MADATRRVYGRWAGVYDRLARLPGLRSWRARAADALELGATDTVVEMGCGTGANLPVLRTRVGPDGRVVGLDLTREMLVRACKRDERSRVDADLVQADATRPPVDGPVDAVLATFVVAMFEDPAAVVDAWCDLVRPGGRVALLHFGRSDRRWTWPLDAAYRGFVWLAATEKRVGSDVAAAHDVRVRQAHRALAAGTTDYRELRLAGGYLRLASGAVPGR